MTRPGELASLRNLGPQSARWLQAVGVHTEAELRALGAVNAYRLLVLHGYRPSMNLVYAIEGSLRDEHWARLAPEIRQRLRAQAAAPWDARELLERD